MCPVPWASWTLFFFQIAFAAAGVVAMVFISVSTYVHHREMKKSEAQWNAARNRLEAVITASPDTGPAHPKADA